MTTPRTQKPAALQLRLYVAGSAPNSIAAITNLNAVCEEHFPHAYVVEIIDLLREPLRALVDGIIVTPTLVKLFPLPICRIIGNLSNTKALVVALGHS